MLLTNTNDGKIERKMQESPLLQFKLNTNLNQNIIPKKVRSATSVCVRAVWLSLARMQMHASFKIYGLPVICNLNGIAVDW